jgi:hypothetical protein
MSLKHNSFVKMLNGRISATNLRRSAGGKELACFLSGSSFMVLLGIEHKQYVHSAAKYQQINQQLHQNGASQQASQNTIK